MSVHAAFDLVRDETIPEIASEVRLYRHKKTGAEVLSFVNDDENKVFGVSFGTPPTDSTGIAHILEHSVLCGSRKYPVKEPFVELMKYEHARACSYFERAASSLPEQDRASMFAAEIMGAIYRELLDQIPAVQFDVYRNRLSVSKSRRLQIAFAIWLKSKLKR